MSYDLPQSRIKKIIKLDPEYSGISAAAVHVITKATELFIQDLTSKSSIETRRQQRKKIGYDDFYSVIKNNSSLFFLSDVVPKRYKLRELVETKKVQLREDIDAEEEEEISPEVSHKVASPAINRQGILAFTSNGKDPVAATAAPTATPTIKPNSKSILNNDDDEEIAAKPAKPEVMDVDNDVKQVAVQDEDIEEIEDDDDDDEMIDS